MIELSSSYRVDLLNWAWHSSHLTLYLVSIPLPAFSRPHQQHPTSNFIHSRTFANILNADAINNLSRSSSVYISKNTVSSVLSVFSNQNTSDPSPHAHCSNNRATDLQAQCPLTFATWRIIASKYHVILFIKKKFRTVVSAEVSNSGWRSHANSHREH